MPGLLCADGRVNYLSSFINSGIHKNKSFQRVKTLEAVRVGVGDAELVAAEQVTAPRLQPTGLAGCVSHRNGAGCWCVAQSVMWFVQLLVAPLSNLLYAHGVEGGRIWLAHLVRGSLAVATGLVIAPALFAGGSGSDAQMWQTFG